MRTSCTGLFVLAFCGLGGLIRACGASVFLFGGEDSERDISDDRDVGVDGAGASAAGSIPASASSASLMLRQLTSSDSFSDLDAAGCSAPFVLTLDAAGLVRKGIPHPSRTCGIFEDFLTDVLAFDGGGGIPAGFAGFTSASSKRTFCCCSSGR